MAEGASRQQFFHQYPARCERGVTGAAQQIAESEALDFTVEGYSRDEKVKGRDPRSANRRVELISQKFDRGGKYSHCVALTGLAAVTRHCIS